MKKKILTLLMGCIFIGVNAFAAGDLQVNGALGIGTIPGTAVKATVLTTNTRGMKVTATMDQDGIVNSDILHGLTLKAEMTGNATGDTQGINLMSHVSATSANANGATGGNFIVSFASNTAGSTTVNESATGKFVTYLNAGNHNYNVSQGYGFDLGITDNRTTGSGSLHFTNYKGINLQNPGNAYGALSVDTLAGVWINKQTLGTTKNYGIVLNGDGAGADIVLGAAQNTSIYASGGEIFVKDAGGFATQISPHDPETGEWRFYSKNLKTGRVVEVNMEKLVKAVEKMTGEKFLIETVEGTN